MVDMRPSAVRTSQDKLITRRSTRRPEGTMATVQHQVGQQASGPKDIQLPPPEGAEGTVLDGIRGKVFMDRYALKDEEGRAGEHYPEEMGRRVARAIAVVEPTEDGRREWEQRFYDLLQGFKFVPGGR